MKLYIIWLPFLWFYFNRFWTRWSYVYMVCDAEMRQNLVDFGRCEHPIICHVLFVWLRIDLFVLWLIKTLKKRRKLGVGRVLWNMNKAPFCAEIRGFLRVLINCVKLFEKYFLLWLKNRFIKIFFIFLYQKQFINMWFLMLKWNMIKLPKKELF